MALLLYKRELFHHKPRMFISWRNNNTTITMNNNRILEIVIMFLIRFSFFSFIRCPLGMCRNKVATQIIIMRGGEDSVSSLFCFSLRVYALFLSVHHTTVRAPPIVSNSLFYNKIFDKRNVSFTVNK